MHSREQHTKKFSLVSVKVKLKRERESTAQEKHSTGKGFGKKINTHRGQLSWSDPKFALLSSRLVPGLPTDAMVDAVPAAVAARQSLTAYPAAEGIMTTDRYPKLRRSAWALVA